MMGGGDDLARHGHGGARRPAWFDYDSALNPEQAKHFAARGFRFCLRYISLDDNNRAYNQQQVTLDLSIEEAQCILDAGMALMAVQHVAEPGWCPTPDLGTVYGANAARYAGAGGLPAGVNVWLDLEGIAQGTSSDDIIGYCNNWFAAVAAGGYEPGIYVGYNVFLTADQLYFGLRTKSYWRAAGEIPDVSNRGYQMKQLTDNPGSTNPFDYNVTMNDAFGGTVRWLAANSALVV